jgi:guanine nucleotide-binding protein subunit alpha
MLAHSHLNLRSQILFLNKIDLFAEKLPRSPVEKYFPDYEGGNNFDAACDYFLHRFVSLNKSPASKQIYAHYTCVTDNQQIKCESLSLSRILFTEECHHLVALNAIQDILLQSQLRECALL